MPETADLSPSALPRASIYLWFWAYFIFPPVFINILIMQKYPQVSINVHAPPMTIDSTPWRTKKERENESLNAYVVQHWCKSHFHADRRATCESNQLPTIICISTGIILTKLAATPHFLLFCKFLYFSLFFFSFQRNFSSPVAPE